MSPAPNRNGGTEPSFNSAQQLPAVNTWNAMTCSASGMTLPAISAPAGVSATHGSLASTSKKMAPVSRTARSTSDSTSTPTSYGLPANSSGRSSKPADE